MSKRKQQYLSNKAARVGSIITCPVCGELFTKKQYSQAFCCPYCKDTFWNNKGDRHSPDYYEIYDKRNKRRRERRLLYGATRVISIGGELPPGLENEILEHKIHIKKQIEDYGKIIE